MTRRRGVWRSFKSRFRSLSAQDKVRLYIFATGGRAIDEDGAVIELTDKGLDEAAQLLSTRRDAQEFVEALWREEGTIREGESIVDACRRVAAKKRDHKMLVFLDRLAKRPP